MSTPDKTSINLSVTKPTYDAIKAEADAQDRTLGAQAARILREWAESRPRDKAAFLDEATS